MIKLVASDLDGTLLHNYQQTVPKEIYDTIKALHEKGIIFTAASGRQYANIRRLFAPLGFDIPYIAENGSMCVYKEEILATGLTPSKTIRHILDALMEYRKIYHTGHCILSVKDTYYSDSTDELNRYAGIAGNGAAAFVPQYDADGNQTLVKYDRF